MQLNYVFFTADVYDEILYKLKDASDINVSIRKSLKFMNYVFREVKRFNEVLKSKNDFKQQVYLSQKEHIIDLFCLK